jgi:SagB-type dehydrogenase family enzyme
MKTGITAILAITLLLIVGCTATNASTVVLTPAVYAASSLKLPPPVLTGQVSLEESLRQRRSVREYSTIPLFLAEVSQLLWAAQGMTSDTGGRTAPSAGALYPLEVYLVSGNVENLTAGFYHYLPLGHELIQTQTADLRAVLAQAALGQSSVRDGAADIVISAVYARTTARYGERGIRYADLEAGHCAQNICLQAAAMGLGSVTIGAFDDNQVKQVLGLAENESPLYIIPIGHLR